MDKEILVKKLNEALTLEHADIIRYPTHASAVTGPYSEAIAARLKEIGMDEMLHADKLRKRIFALGGKPTLKSDPEGLVFSEDLNEILDINIEAEKKAIKNYSEILKMISQDNPILYKDLIEIIADEQEHLEELEALKAR